MNGQKWVPLLITAMIAIVASISIFSFTYLDNFHLNSEKKMRGGETDSAIHNDIQNSIKGGQSDVSNSIRNNVNTNTNSPIDNNITNNIDVNINIKVTNNVHNNVKGRNTSSATNEKKDENSSKKGDRDSNNTDKKEAQANEREIVWGVDSADLVTNELFSCVRKNFGQPKVWGRYLGDKEGVSTGLTAEEVEQLHSNNIKILVIWNHFTKATGYANGQREAQEAIVKAQELGIPQSTALFADIEPNYPVDSEFIKGWVETISSSGYKPGIYGIFQADKDLYKAFEEAARNSNKLLEQTYIWTASPSTGITSAANAPAYKPDAPKSSLIGGWQYGIEAQSCHIDTNLFSGNIMDSLW